LKLEVELKARLDQEVYLNMPERLEKLGAKSCGRCQESDRYYNSKYRDFRTTDEALRIRKYMDGDGTTSVFLTYKGPKLDSHSITRAEYEVVISDAGTMAEILESLGYESVLTVSKSRCVYSLDDVHVCLDEVAGLGTFMELEKLEDETIGKKKALDELFTLMKKLQIPQSDLERKSYLELLMEKA